MALLYGPAARCKPKMIDLEKLVLRFCIRPIDGALRLLALMAYPRAFDLIRVSAPKASHLITNALARPFLHLLFPTRRPRLENQLLLLD
jgi:hypothetical protein